MTDSTQVVTVYRAGPLPGQDLQRPPHVGVPVHGTVWCGVLSVASPMMNIVPGFRRMATGNTSGGMAYTPEWSAHAEMLFPYCCLALG